MDSKWRETVLVFCTSAEVRACILNELNEAWTVESTPLSKLYIPRFYNDFHPAVRDPTDIPESRQQRFDFDVELFEGFSDADLREFFMERYVPVGKHCSSVINELFAVLDERSTYDDTVTIHSKELIVDEGTAAVIGARWHSWRVKFNVAITLARWQLGYGDWKFVEDVLYKPEVCAHFTGGNGVFDLQRAVNEHVELSTLLGVHLKL